ncbi:MAG: hypothetical protein K0Q93_2932 [Nocardioidaceae bacterium]|nr:hypothetical protein [Nocardioidaceae bacterium]
MAEERDDVEVAWARIVADYDREVTDPVSRWPVQEDLPDPADESAADGSTASEAPAAATRPEAADEDLLVPLGSSAAAADADADDESRQSDLDDQAELEESDSDHHFIPPDPPPLGRPDPLMGIAWGGVFGGPAMLMLAAALGITLPSVVITACLIGFVGGVIFLVASMDDGPGRDGWDNGAQV